MRTRTPPPLQPCLLGARSARPLPHLIGSRGPEMRSPREGKPSDPPRLRLDEMRRSHLKAAAREDDGALGAKRPETLGTGALGWRRAGGRSSGGGGKESGGGFGRCRERRASPGGERTSWGGESDGSRKEWCGGGPVASGSGRFCGACERRLCASLSALGREGSRPVRRAAWPRSRTRGERSGPPEREATSKEHGPV